MIHLFTHEYGHQRAGLTDNTPKYASLYHTGPLPPDRQDVMVRGASYAELWVTQIPCSTGGATRGRVTTQRAEVTWSLIDWFTESGESTLCRAAGVPTKSH